VPRPNWRFEQQHRLDHRVPRRARAPSHWRGGESRYQHLSLGCSRSCFATMPRSPSEWNDEARTRARNTHQRRPPPWRIGTRHPPCAASRGVAVHERGIAYRACGVLGEPATRVPYRATFALRVAGSHLQRTAPGRRSCWHRHRAWVQVTVGRRTIVPGPPSRGST